MLQIADNSENIYADYLKDKEIKPHPVQEEFLELPDDVFEALYGGAAYGGKTWLLAMLPLFRGFYKYPGFKGILLRRKHTESEKEIIRVTKDFYPKTGATYNEQKHAWEWQMDGYSTYMDFGHVQHEHDIESYDTAQYNYCGFDELTSFSAYPYHYMVGSRVRPSSEFKIAIARSGTNPGGIGQTFVYKRFVEPNEDGRQIIRDKATGLYRIFIPAKAEDNPHGLEYDPNYVKKLEILRSVSEATYRAKRFGDWHAFKGSVFTTFRPIRFPGEPDNALHVIKPFPIPSWWPRVLSIDWGKRAMCYAMWGAISPDHRVYVYRERKWYGRDISHWASEIRIIHDENEETPTLTILCGSAWQNRGSSPISEEFTKYSDLVPISSDNTAGSRIAGLQVVHDFLRWEKKPTIKAKGEIYLLDKAMDIYRRHGAKALEEYRSQFLDEPEETNIPILQIFDTCKTLIDTIPMATYDEKKIEDVAEFDGDDPLDDLRYFCKKVKAFLLGEISGLDELARRNAIIQEMQESGDMTSFYRRMENLERQTGITSIVTPGESSIPVAISRRSRFARRRFH